MRYVFGNYVLDAQRYELRRGGTPIKLRPKVFDVLAYLIVHRERVVTKQELLEHLWPHQCIGDATLNSCIMEARQAVGDTGQAQRVIQTLYGRGYRFVAAVEVPSPEPPAVAPRATSTGPRDLGSHTQDDLDTAASTVSAPAAPAQPDRTPLSSLEGERKPITVLCCALANATGLAEALGPDAMHGLMQGFLTLARREVQRYEGTMVQYRGDGFMALFGAPLAHEDHARRGVLTAIGLQRRLCEHGATLEHTSGEALAVCIGLHTGLVVVGGLGDDGGKLFTAVGPTMQIAIQLQQLAAPGTILLSEALRRLLAGYVNVEPFRSPPTTDQTASPPAYTLIGLAPRRSPVAEGAERALRRFVGRQRELVALHALLTQAEGGQGQVVGVVGEAGLGKSRLLEEFRLRLQGQAVTYLEGRCLAYGQQMPYLPVLEFLRQQCGIAEAGAPATISMKVRSTLQEVGMDPEAGAPWLLQLLGVPLETEPSTMPSPETIRLRTFATLQQLSLHASRQRPLILVVEDLHWIDATSEAWLVSLVDRMANAPILLLTTYRPGYRPCWMDKSYATQIALPRLTPQESQYVVQAVLHTAPLADAVLQEILEKGAGNPFFLEELARAAVESGAHGPTLVVPDTVQAVLAARVDRLTPEAKQLLQTAAVIGIDVPGAPLQAIMGWPEETVRQGLSHLQAAEFLYETRLGPEVDYRFKQALTHEVAYGSLLQERRRRLHVRTVEALETLYAMALSTAGGDVFQQARAQSLLGTFYFTRGDYHCAIDVLKQSMAILEGEVRHTRLGLMVTSARSRVWLAECLGELGEFAAALAYAEDAARIAEAAAHLSSTLLAQGRCGRLALRQGDLQRAIPLLERALAQCRASDVQLLLAGSTVALGQAYALAGRIAEALPLLAQAVVSEDTALGGPALMTRQGEAYLLAGRLAEALPLAEHAVALAGERKERGNQAWALRLLGEIVAHRDPPTSKAADSAYCQALALAEALGMRPLQAHCHHGLGTLYGRRGWIDQARTALSAAVALYRAMGMRFWQYLAETILAQWDTMERLA
jgi:class 3 adenylate cyclase/tetratricopeptide (TPR) repeat protein